MHFVSKFLANCLVVKKPQILLTISARLQPSLLFKFNDLKLWVRQTKKSLELNLYPTINTVLNIWCTELCDTGWIGISEKARS